MCGLRLPHANQLCGNASVHGRAGAEPTAEDVVNQLEARLNSLPASARPALPADGEAVTVGASSTEASSSSSSSSSDPLRSFSDTEDSELAWSLNRRISQIATATASPEGMENEISDDEVAQQEPEVVPLTGVLRPSCRIPCL